MLVETLLLLLLVVGVWWVKLRPTSPYNRRPPYRTLQASPQGLEVDYVVIGAGPAGLAAARTLLEKHTTTSADRSPATSEAAMPSILLIEKGQETLKTDVLGEIMQAPHRDRLLSFSPDMVYVPTGAIPGPALIPVLSAAVDQRCVVHRPLRFGTPGFFGTTDNSLTSENKDPAVQEREEVKDAFLHYTAYPRGCGVGGSSRLDWGLHMESAFASTAQGANAESTTRPTVRTAKESDPDEPSVPAAEDEPTPAPHTWWQVPVRFTIQRSPLSWSFAEAVVAAGVVKRKFLSSSELPHASDATFPALLRIDQDGRRLPLAPVLFKGLPPKQCHSLAVLTGHTVSRMTLTSKTKNADLCRDTEEETPAPAHDRRASDAGEEGAVPVVTCVYCHPTQWSVVKPREAEVAVRVRKGVVVAAGVVHTPRLLHRSIPRCLPMVADKGAPLTQTWLRDALALPILFKTYHGVSCDSCNTRDTRGAAMWFLTQRGPFLQPMVDTLASVPLPELGPKAELVLFLLPFGGRDPQRYYALGWDRSLAAFKEAVAVLLVLQGVEELQMPLELNEDGATTPSSPSQRWRRQLEQRRLHPLSCPAQAFLSDPVQTKVRSGFRKGLQLARRVAATPPLSHLCAGGEAIDFTLLIEDPMKALQLARLVHSRPEKMTRQMRKDLVDLSGWAAQVSRTDTYLDAYIASHTYWLGFGSGSSEPFLQQAPSASPKSASPFHVKGAGNVVVGDCSAVTTARWCDACRGRSLVAGSVSTAIDAGRLAAEALHQSR